MFKALSAKKKQLEEEPEKTLDLLDELLFTIHSTRTNVLESRARKYEKRVEKRKEKAKMAMRRANRGTFIDERDRDVEIDELFQDVAQDFQAPAPETKQKGGGESSDVAEETMQAVSSLSIGGGAPQSTADRMRKSMQFMNDALDNDIEQKEAKKEAKKEKKNKAAKLLQGTADTYGGREELQNDFHAATIFEEFREELTDELYQTFERKRGQGI